jgi:hypothetical protein
LNWTSLPVPARQRRPQLQDASAADRSRAHQYLAEVARNHLTLRALQWQAVTEASLVNQREALRIVGARLDAGRDTAQISRARTLVAH